MPILWVTILNIPLSVETTNKPERTIFYMDWCKALNNLYNPNDGILSCQLQLFINNAMHTGSPVFPIQLNPATQFELST